MIKNEWHIRTLLFDEYEQLIALWEEARLSHKPYGRDSRSKIQTETERKHGVFLVAEFEGRLIGSVLASHDGRKGWINRLAVLPDYRRQGLAKSLIIKAEEWLTAQSIEIFTCLIEDGNDASLALFRSMEYQEFHGIHYLTKRLRSDI